MGEKTLSAIQDMDSLIGAEDILRLEFREIEDDQEKGVLIFCSSMWKYIWESRYKSSKQRLFEIRSYLESRCHLLRDGRAEIAATTVENLCNCINV